MEIRELVLDWITDGSDGEGQDREGTEIYLRKGNKFIARELINSGLFVGPIRAELNEIRANPAILDEYYQRHEPYECLKI